MNKRIRELRKKIGLTQQDFADRIGVKQSTIATYEMGRNEPSNPIINAICSTYNVNEEWLRTGEGEMFQDLSQGELAARLVGEALSNDDKFIQSVFIALGKLGPAEWQLVKNFAKTVEKEMNEKK